MKLKDIPDSTPEEQAKIRQWLQGGGKKATDPTAPAPEESSDPSVLSQIGSGLARGAYSNVAGLETAASKIPGMGWAAPSKGTEEWLNRGDAGWAETGARLVGEYAPLALMPEFGWAGRAGKLAEAATKGVIGGVAGTGDPKEGAAAGAVTGVAPTIAREAWNMLPPEARWLAKGGAGLAGIMAAEDMLKGRGHSYVPWWYLGHTAPSALAALATMAMRLPGAAGRGGAELYKDVTDGDQGETKGQ